MGAIAGGCPRRDAFALDSTRSENGVHYLPAPRKIKLGGEVGAK